MQARRVKLLKFLQARLSPEGFLGLYLTLGVMAVIVATWIFSAIDEDVVTGDRLVFVDVRFSNWLHEHAVQPLTKIMLWVSMVHAALGITIMTLAVSVWLWQRRLHYWVLRIMLSVFGGMLLNVILKHIFRRPRPHFANPIVTLTSYGFPSGHTMMATVFYGSLWALVVSRTHGLRWRAVAILAPAFMLALVGFR